MNLRNTKIPKAATFFLSIVLLTGVIRCASTTQAERPISDSSWSSGMRGMAADLEKLMPYVFSKQEYNDPDNQKAVKGIIANFVSGVDQVPRHAGEVLLGKDPIVQYSILRLKENTTQALQAFNEGQIEYSRIVLRENVSLCFSCHSTQNLGPQYNFVTTALGSKFRLTPSERADYYVATRQFDKAIDSLNAIIQSPANMLENPHEQLNALRKYLFLQVRVKNNPEPAIKLLEKYLTWSRLPYFMAQDARVWIDSLKSWQNEEKSQKNSIRLAQKLIRKAEDNQVVSYHAGMVDYLRASMLLHKSLLIANSPREKARIYSLLGESYETLAELGIWDLPEIYYEACVRILPQSPVAKKCYKDFERFVILGFSGSAGIFIPKEERERMIELRKLAGLQVDEIEQTEDTLPSE